MNADELRSFIFGGPGDHVRWTVMVVLAARADDKGVVRVCDDAEIAEWICQTEGWARHAVKKLKAEGWIRQHTPGYWLLRDLTPRAT